MPFKSVFLWTDILLYLLLVLMVMFVITARKNILLRSAYQHVSQRPLAMFSFTIFLFFAFIAFLDSIHFHPFLSMHEGTPIYSTRVKSLLDVLIAPLGEHATKTFTAPFADPIVLVSISKLIWGGVWAFMKGMGVFIAVFLSTVWFLSHKYQHGFLQQSKLILNGQSQASWRSIFFGFFLIIMATTFVLYLSQYYHILGTDKVGGDVFYQATKSIRTGLIIGTLTTLLMLPFAIFFGTIAGYFSGWIDDVVQYIYTTISSIPGILLIAAAVLSLEIFINSHADMFSGVAERADARLLMLCAILGLTAWTDLCRLIRAETLKLREMDFVQAAKVMGVRRRMIILRHIVPNLMHIILITIVLNFSMLVLAEAVLSYVGVGVDPTTMSWGNMINSARFELAREPVVWWPLLAAFVFMFVLVFCANVFADALRDALDPRIHRSRLAR